MCLGGFYVIKVNNFSIFWLNLDHPEHHSLGWGFHGSWENRFSIGKKPSHARTGRKCRFAGKNYEIGVVEGQTVFR